MIKKLAAFLFLALMIGSAGFLIRTRERDVALSDPAAVPGPAPDGELRKAMHWTRRGPDIILCKLCPNACRLSDGEIGDCRVRKNIGGELCTLSYGLIAACHTDPIEKKPFFHVLPGTTAYSIATPGCNMRCLFCQNWEISQAFPWEVRTQRMTPEEVVEAAILSGAKSIAFTYSEPIIFYEYMLDIAKLARAKGLKTVVVSNGYINPEPLKDLLQFIDAYKVDFKAFNDQFYEELTGGSLEPVLETMKTIRRQGVWLEIVTLLIPGKNDSDDEIRRLAAWIHENLGDDVPLHFSRFHPQHKLMNLPPTPADRVARARQLAKEAGLKYVYTGNVPYPEGESTVVPGTGEIAIERRGYFIVRNNLKNGVAPSGARIPGVWE